MPRLCLKVGRLNATPPCEASRLAHGSALYDGALGFKLNVNTRSHCVTFEQAGLEVSFYRRARVIRESMIQYLRSLRFIYHLSFRPDDNQVARAHESSLLSSMSRAW